VGAARGSLDEEAGGRVVCPSTRVEACGKSWRSSMRSQPGRMLRCCSSLTRCGPTVDAGVVRAEVHRLRIELHRRRHHHYRIELRRRHHHHRIKLRRGGEEGGGGELGLARGRKEEKGG
jgi:hypothetical protein